MTRLLILGLLLSFTGCKAQMETKKEMSSEARAYLDEFFDLVQPIALDGEAVDWPNLRQFAEENGAGAQQPKDLHAILKAVLRRINKHSNFFTPEQMASFSNTGQGGEPNVELATGHRINEKIAYLSIPGVGSAHLPSLVAFADSLQALIASLDTETTRGWVLDLRDNPGGNCWPMLAGIGPLLGEGTCGYFMSRNGENAQSWAYRDGTSYMADFAQLSISGAAYELLQKDFKIAVLTGSNTMSSGEVLTVAFRGKTNARSFGQPTGGYSTTNATHQLSDGAMVILTVSIYGDRDKNGYDDKVVPDVVIDKTDEGDSTLAGALKWLEGK